MSMKNTQDTTWLTPKIDVNKIFRHGWEIVYIIYENKNENDNLPLST